MNCNNCGGWMMGSTHVCPEILVQVERAQLKEEAMSEPRKSAEELANLIKHAQALAMVVANLQAYAAQECAEKDARIAWFSKKVFGLSDLNVSYGEEIGRLRAIAKAAQRRRALGCFCDSGTRNPTYSCHRDCTDIQTALAAWEKSK